MNLFVLTGDPSRRIARIQLSKQMQDEIETIFKKQENEFNETCEDEFTFDGKYKPDYGECLCIDEFDDIDNIHGAIKNPLSVQTIDHNIDSFERIKAIFSGYIDAGKSIALIQHFERKRILSPSRFSGFFSGDVFTKISGVGLTLDTKLTAILTDKKLRFNSFHVLRSIFDVTGYYKEATDADIRTFAQNDIIHISNINAFNGVADTWIRRKISLISQSGILNIDVETINEAAKRSGVSIQVTKIAGKNKIFIPDDKKEIKQLLRFLDEDYFESSIQKFWHVTNSKRKL